MSPTFPLTHRPTAYTLIELLAVMFVVAMTGLVEESVAHRFGRWTGIGAGAVTLIICVMGVMLFYRWSWKRDRRRLQELREKYRGIYRVIALNDSIFDDSNVLPAIDLGHSNREIIRTRVEAIALSRKSSGRRCKRAPQSIISISSGTGDLSEMEGGYAAYRISKAALNAVT